MLDKESESFFVVQCCEVVGRIVKRDTRFLIGTREDQFLILSNNNLYFDF